MPARPEVTGRAVDTSVRRRGRLQPSRAPSSSEDVAREAFSVAEFCTAHRISRASYYNQRKRGEGPDELHVGSRVLITLEAAHRWRRRRTTRGLPQRRKPTSHPDFQAM
jgi:hypothetical protein